MPRRAPSTVARLRSTGLVIEAYIRFKGEPATMFFLHPWGEAVEMKSFADLGSLFAK